MNAQKSSKNYFDVLKELKKYVTSKEDDGH